MDKVKVDIDYLRKIQDYRTWVNSLEFDRIMFVDSEGNEHHYNEKDKEDFKFTGLNNTDFVLFFKLLVEKEKK